MNFDYDAARDFLARENAEIEARYQTNLIPPRKKSGINWTEVQPESWINSNPKHSNRDIGREVLKPFFESVE